MLFKYSTAHPSQTLLDSLPRVPLLLESDSQSLEVIGLVDSGSTINVLPYSAGLRLGLTWDERKARIPLSGNLSNTLAQPVLLVGTLGDYEPVQLTFAWIPKDNVPVILGQTNFFDQFQICFYRSKFVFEVKPR